MILLHGENDTGKTTLAVSLVVAAGKLPLLFNPGENEAPLDLQADLDGFQVSMDAGTQALIVDDDDFYLHSEGPFQEVFNRQWLDNFMASNRLTIIWVSHSIDDIPSRVLRNFDYVLELIERPGAKFRWPESVPAMWRPKLERFNSLPASDLSKCVNVWTRTLLDDDGQDASLARLVDLLERRSPRSTRKTNTASLAPISIAFDPALWNADRPLLEVSRDVGRYLDWVVKNPDQCQPYGILASGLPGTGKTEWAKFLAKEHGRELQVYRYSDLASKWVGETEARIAEVFREASPGDFILFDEVDSLVSDRIKASAYWQRTQTNEILTQIENFPGVLIACTNLTTVLDPAIARRFVSKVTFSPLRADQLVRAWQIHFPKVEAPMGDLLSLAGSATPGDFRLVANGLQFRETTPEASEILRMLRFEQEAKRRLTGESARVGFHV